MFVKLTVSLVGWAAGASAIATAPPTDLWDFLYRVFWVSLGVGAGTLSRLSTWVVEVEAADGVKRKVIDKSLMWKDLAAVGIYFVGGFTLGAATGWMAELVGLIAMCFALVGVVGTRKLIFDVLGAALKGAVERLPSSPKPDGDAT